MAVAAGVAGSVSNLTPDHVEVIDMTSNRRFTPPDPNNPLAHDVLEKRRMNERAEEEKLRSYFAYIPGVQIIVHAELDNEIRNSTSEKFTGEPAIKSERITERLESDASQAAGPGGVANNSLAITGAGAGRRSEETDTESEFSDQRDSVRETVQNLVGAAKSFTAAIMVPREYFIAAYKKQPSATDPPDPNALDTYIENQLADIREHARMSIGATDPSQVVASVYDGGGFVLSPEGGYVMASSLPVSGADASVMGYVENYGAQAGLGALALISLGMMLMFVRRANEGPPLPEDKPLIPEPDDDDVGILAVESAPVGQAATSGGLLMAKEVDEQTLRTREMVEQLGSMVTEDPETAAQLVERWITRDA
jgi:flagellar biosynthesis/type III secretory pathway M-ring protein FliF/YscJ